MNIDDTVYDALKILIKISKNAQDAAPEQTDGRSPMSWINEYCTVRASTARRGGHTTAILKLIEENGMNIGCIFENHFLEKNFKSIYNSRKDKRINGGKLEFSMLKNNFNDCRGRYFPKLDALIVDNAFFCSQKDKNNISELACALGHPRYRIHRNTNKNFFLIFLQ